jgi:hypothetical protein
MRLVGGLNASKWKVGIRRSLQELPIRKLRMRCRQNASLARCLRYQWGCGIAVALLIPAVLSAQNRDLDRGPGPDAEKSRVTMHGVVLNATSNEPLPRALVRLAGDGGTAALTDGEGRYELADVPTGPQLIEVLKPGFLDEIGEAAALGGADAREFAHTVIVTRETSDVTFRMEPANAIHGQVQLSTGDVAEGIEITLLRQMVESGRLVWQMASTAKTNVEGAYRFGGLPDGVYALYSAPALDDDPGGPFQGSPPMDSKLPYSQERGGYPSQFYPEARDLAGAAKIQLQNGEQTEANLMLTREIFHAVTVTVASPASADGQNKNGQDFSPDRPGTTLSAIVTDGEGHALPYVAQYDPTAHTVGALLPDGSYTLIATAGRPRMIARRGGLDREDGPYTGAVEFSVNGHALTNLRLALANAPRYSLQVNLEGNSAASQETRSSAAATLALNRSELVLTVSQTGSWAVEGGMSTFAVGPLTGPLHMMFTPPGTYWVHTNLSDKRYCADSLLAGGSNLGREPLTVGVSSSPTPLTLNLRDDCADLTLTLPATAAGSGMGEEPFYTVYVVPDFDSTQDVIPQTLRASNGGQITLQGLTPGSYHVYIFNKPVALAYRERAVRDALPQRGQTIGLMPGQTANLLLEVAAHQ